MSLVDPDRESNRESRVEWTRGEQKSVRRASPLCYSELTTSFAAPSTAVDFKNRGHISDGERSDRPGCRHFLLLFMLNFPKANPRPCQVFFMF